MEKISYIHLKSNLLEIHFEWHDFDGDDCFKDFHIIVRDEKTVTQFAFGPCAVFGLRKLRKFFSDRTQKTAGLGFRNPDIRYCDVFRKDSDYRLKIQFEGSNLCEEFVIKQPDICIDHHFSDIYDEYN
jgi:hypothetical protein